MEIWKVDTKPTIVYEEADFLVIDKPWGLIVHPKNADDLSYSVTQWLIESYPEAKSVGEDPLRPGIVHRLDRETSGLLVLTKTQAAFEYFKNLFQSHTIQKTYTALVQGSMKDDKGVIDAPMGRVGMKRTTRRVRGALVNEKEAVTEYTVLQRFADYTLVEAKPRTGRTHQLRVHFKSIGHPIVCDRVYGGKNMVCPIELGRLFLHAQKLEFTTPSGKSLSLETDLPEGLQNYLNTLQ
jgi:23S rRNA pseudouridine1911/1915/1917 synthase